MMGSGKTTVGQLLARRLGWPYRDNDAELAQGPGAARRLLAATDQAELRAAEIRTLNRLLDEPMPSIVAAAGGTILDPTVRDRLRAAGFVVWLRATPATILDRVGAHDDRPWRAGGRRAWVERAVAERAALYGAVADLVLDVDAAAPAWLVEDIVAALP
jgi:shikimate kinase